MPSARPRLSTWRPLLRAVTRRERGPRPIPNEGDGVSLTRSQVVDVAVDLVRRYGLGDLSMRRLARELGVAPGAIYWHVDSKQALIVEVADRLLCEIGDPSPDLPPVEAVAWLASALRDVVAGVPDGADVIGVACAVDPGGDPPAARAVAGRRPARALARGTRCCRRGDRAPRAGFSCRRAEPAGCAFPHRFGPGCRRPPPSGIRGRRCEVVRGGSGRDSHRRGHALRGPGVNESAGRFRPRPAPSPEG